MTTFSPPRFSEKPIGEERRYEVVTSWWPMRKMHAAGIAIAVSMVFVVFALVIMPEETLAGKSLAVARATLALFGCALGFSVFAALSGLGDRMRRSREENKPPLDYDEWKKY